MATPKARRGVIIVLSGLLVLMIAMSVFWFVKYQRTTHNTPAARQKSLTAQLDQIAEVPSEQPVISTVLDHSKLTNAALASRAHNGDELFIYPKSKRLILYRPSDKKVVDMLNIQS